MTKKTKTDKTIALNRYGWMVVFLSIGFIAVIVSICKIKFIEGSMWRQLGKEVTVKKNREIRPNRGNIYADDGRLLAISEPLYGVYIDFMSEGIKKDTLMKYVQPLSVALAKKFPDRSAAQYKKIIMDGWALSRQELEYNERVRKEGSKKRLKNKSRYVRIIRPDINYVDLKEIKTYPYLNQRSNRSGLLTEEKTMRLKPFGALAGRTVGSIYKDFEMGGASGLELKYDSLLRGEKGAKTRQRIQGRWIDVIAVEPKDGLDVKTTLDVDIQDITERALRNKLIELKAESGCAVIMEVETGEIKAIANLDRMADGVYAEGNPNVFSYMSEPGSTFKTVSLMVALEDGVITPEDQLYVGNGLFEYNRRVVRDHDWRKGKDKGYITVAEAMYTSSNVGLAKMVLKGYEDNPTKYVQHIHDLGLTRKIEWDVPLEGREGTVAIRFPGDKYNPWSKTTLAWMAFGYETQVPPIYMLMFYNGIANNGKMIKPYITKAIMKDGKVIEEFDTEVINSSMCSEKTLHQVQDILRGVVEKGTAKAVNSDMVTVAGKTGTAMIASGGGYSGYYVSFCGYFPIDKPKYTCFVGIRRPQGSPSGGLMPGAVFRNIAENVYARNFVSKPVEAPKDTVHTHTPKVKSGSYNYTKIVLNKIGQDYKDLDEKSEWVVCATEEGSDNLSIKSRSVIQNLIPNVIGMGARDAIYLLENAGLKVVIHGSGKVVEQSIQPGAKLVRGSVITIQLK
jgi:cell division protein FtsI (penicillin-binding protein 3)